MMIFWIELKMELKKKNTIKEKNKTIKLFRLKQII